MSKSIPMIKSKKIALIAFIAFVFIAMLISVISNRPELYFICTVVFILEMIALFYDNILINSLIVSTFPLYTVVIILTISGMWGAWIFHFIIYGLVIYFVVKRWRNTYPIVVFSAVFLWIALGYEFRFYTNFGNEDSFYTALMNFPMIMVFVISTALLAIVINFLKKGKRTIKVM